MTETNVKNILLFFGGFCKSRDVWLRRRLCVFWNCEGHFFGILQNLNSNRYFSSLSGCSRTNTGIIFSPVFAKIFGKENVLGKQILHPEFATKKRKGPAVAQNKTPQQQRRRRRHFITTATVNPGLMTYALVL